MNSRDFHPPAKWAGRCGRLCLLLAGLASTLPAAAANGYFLHGFSTSQRAMAGAGTALAGEAAQLPVNPAGILGVREQWTADLNVLLVHNKVEAGERPAGAGAGLFSIEPGTIRSVADNFMLPFAAYAHAIDDSSAWAVSFNGGGLQSIYEGGRSRFAEGLPALSARCEGVFAGGGPVVGTTDPAGLCGGGDPVSSGDLVQLYFRAGYARRFGDTLSIGVSPIVVVEYFKARGLSAFKGYSVASDRVTDNGHPRSPSVGYGGRIGVLWSPVEGTSLGASYQSRIRLRGFEDYTGLIISDGEIDSPALWSLGLAWRPGAAHLLAADFERVQFSDIPALGRRLDSQAFASQCVMPRLLLGAQPSEACFGGKAGPGFGWQDTLSYKIGYRYAAAENLALSLGYTWTRRPVLDDQVLFNILAPGVTEDHYAAGLSWRPRPRLSFNVAALYSPRRGVKGKNPLSHVDAAALFALPGAPGSNDGAALFGSDPLDQEIRVSAQVTELIFGVQVGF